MDKYIDLEILNWSEKDVAIINKNDFQKEDLDNLIFLAQKNKIEIVEKENQIIFID